MRRPSFGQCNGLPSGKGEETALHGIRQFDELDLEIVVLLEPVTQGEHAESLGGVVPGCKVVDAVLGCLVQDPLGGFARDVGVETRGYGLMVFALGGTGDDPDRRHLAPTSLEDLWFPLTGIGHGGEQLLCFDGFGKDTADTGRHALMIPEGFEFNKAEPGRELRCVAENRMAVQGKVVGDERDPIFDQEPHPFTERPHDTRRLRPVPQNAVVDQNGVRVVVHSPGEERARRRNSGHHAIHTGPPLHLEAVGTVVGNRINVQQLVKLGNNMQEVHGAMLAQGGPGGWVIGGASGSERSTISPMVAFKVRTPFVLTAVALVLVSGCGDRSSDMETVEPGYRVRLLTAKPVSGRWERSAEEGLGRIAAELGADVARLRTTEEVGIQALLRGQGEEGVDLVFCVGPGFDNAVFANAPSFPSTQFVLLPGRAHGANVTGVEFMPDGAGYVAGVVAAKLGSSRSVGVLRGAGGPWLDHLESGFIRGFLSEGYRHEAVVLSAPEGPWELAQQGANVALYATDRPEGDVLAAAHDAGVLLVAADSSLMAAEPYVVAVAIHVDVAEAMLRLARGAFEQGPTAGFYSFGLGSGVVDVRLNPSLPETSLPTVLEALEVARSEVTAGLVEMEDLGI